MSYVPKACVTPGTPPPKARPVLPLPPWRRSAAAKSAAEAAAVAAGPQAPLVPPPRHLVTQKRQHWGWVDTGLDITGASTGYWSSMGWRIPGTGLPMPAERSPTPPPAPAPAPAPLPIPPPPPLPARAPAPAPVRRKLPAPAPAPTPRAKPSIAPKEEHVSDDEEVRSGLAVLLTDVDDAEPTHTHTHTHTMIWV